MRRIVAGCLPLSVSEPVHLLHVFRHIAGRPKTEKDGDGCRVAAVHVGELRWKGIHHDLDNANPQCIGGNFDNLRCSERR
jgi:hypothetical protein